VSLLLSSDVRPATVEAYYDALASDGPTPFPGSPGTFWQRHESLSMVRFPHIELRPPSPAEIRRVLWRAPAAALEYQVAPSPERPANSVLYVLEQQDLPRAISHQARQNVRRAERELTFEFIDAGRLRAHGLRAFCETRQRNGLSDGTRGHFETYTRAYDRVGRRLLAAWHEDELVAYMAITVVDDFALVEGSFSLTEARVMRPNDGLTSVVVDYFLAGDRCRIVSYGLAPLGPDVDLSGLHKFKTKVGFRAVPVRRCYAVHTLLRPCVNRVTAKSMDKIVSKRPQSRPLRKAAGVLRSLTRD
jgi:hypothetical protein